MVDYIAYPEQEQAGPFGDVMEWVIKRYCLERVVKLFWQLLFYPWAPVTEDKTAEECISCGGPRRVMPA